MNTQNFIHEVEKLTLTDLKSFNHIREEAIGLISLITPTSELAMMKHLKTMDQLKNNFEMIIIPQPKTTDIVNDPTNFIKNDANYTQTKIPIHSFGVVERILIQNISFYKES